MAVVETRILTIGWDTASGMFDDSVLREYLAEREVLRSEPQFFVHGGQPYWTVFLETRLLQGVEARAPDDTKKQEEKAAALKELLTDLDEVQRARYQRLLHWRREAAVREGVPPYVVCDNRQAMDLARVAPATLQALGAIKGFGAKRLKKHGRDILEVLHGRIPEPGTGPADPVRALDGHDEVAADPHGPVPEASAPEPDDATGERRSGDPGGGDGGGVPAGPDGDPGRDQ